MYVIYKSYTCTIVLTYYVNFKTYRKIEIKKDELKMT